MIGGMAALPKNAELAEQFDLLADLLELEGAESFRVLAYRRAATRMRETSGSSGWSPAGPNTFGNCSGSIRPRKRLQSVTVSGPPLR